MSLNISKKILAVSKVTVETRVSDLPKRQQTNLKRMVRTGMISGTSVPATLAKHVLKSRGLPYVTRWHSRSEYVTPVNCPLGSAGHEFIKEMYAKSILEGDERYPPVYSSGYCPARNHLENPDEKKGIELLGSVVEWMFKEHSFDHEVEIGEVIVVEFGVEDCYRSM